MAKRNIVVIGGSMGSFEVLKAIVAGMPAELDAAIFIVWHMSPDLRGVVPQALNKGSQIEVSEARDKEPIEFGRVYVARPDHHLLLIDNEIRVARGPKENRFRPAIDPLFRSAAYSFGPRVIGIILSGGLDDGSSGLWSVKQHGGVAIAQDPNDAEVSSMPLNAIRVSKVDYVVPSAEIPGLIERLVSEEVDEKAEAFMQSDEIKEQTHEEVLIAAEDNAFKKDTFAHGELTPFTCPDCSGVLAKLRDGDRVRFRCHTGHAFSPDTLLVAVTENIEQSLWSAVRAVDESIMLLTHLGEHYIETGKRAIAAEFFEKANEAEQRNEQIRQVLFQHELLTREEVEKDARSDGDRELVNA